MLEGLADRDVDVTQWLSKMLTQGIRVVTRDLQTILHCLSQDVIGLNF